MLKIHLSTNMEFFKNVDANCDCSNHIRVTAAVIFLASLMIDCFTSCRRDKKIERLENENQTLKSVILSTVDQALMRMMKNGCNDDDKID